MKRIIIILIACLPLQLFAQSEGFDAQLIIGVSGAQIRGDLVAGFDKLGIESGVGLSYPIKDNLDVGIEFLFSQRGSQLKFIPDNTGPEFKIALNYAAIPLIVHLKDWVKVYNGEEYHKVSVHAGVIYGRLFSSSINDDFNPDASEALKKAFNKTDISWAWGFGLNFNTKWGAEFRSNRSLTKLFKGKDHPEVISNDLLPYHLSLRLLYNL